MVAQGVKERLFSRFGEKLGLDLVGHAAFDLLEDVADALVGRRKAFGFRQLHELAHGLQALGRLHQAHVAQREHRVDFLRAVARIAHHHAQAVKEEVHERFFGIGHARHLGLDRKGGLHEIVERNVEFLFDHHAQHAERVTAQRKRILVARGHLSDAEHAGEGLKLVGQGHGNRNGGRRERVARKARLVVLADRERHVVGLAVVTGVVLAHDALQFGELAHHQSAQVGLGKRRGAFGLLAVGADALGHGGGDGAHAQHALGLAAQLVVVDDVLQALDAVRKLRLAVLRVEELGVGKTRAHHTGVARNDRGAPVLGLDVRHEAEAVHELAGGIAHREVLLVGLHRENEAFLRHGEELLLEFGDVDHGPLGKRIGFVDQILGRNERAAFALGGLVQKPHELFATLGVACDHLAFIEKLLRVAVGRADLDGLVGVEAVPHRRAAGRKAEHLHALKYGVAVEHHEVLDRTNELHRRHAVDQLIVHHLRNRKGLDGLLERLLHGFSHVHAGAHAFVDELFVLAVVDAL